MFLTIYYEFKNFMILYDYNRTKQIVKQKQDEL